MVATFEGTRTYYELAAARSERWSAEASANAARLRGAAVRDQRLAAACERAADRADERARAWGDKAEALRALAKRAPF